LLVIVLLVVLDTRDAWFWAVTGNSEFGREGVLVSGLPTNRKLALVSGTNASITMQSTPEA
jgi:hypothetical protein